MHPILFEVAGRPIGTYGVSMVLGAAAAFGLLRLIAGRKYNDTVWMVFLICICGAVTGSFFFRPLTKIPELFINWEIARTLSMGEIMGFLFGEIVFYGGLIGGFAAFIIFCRKFNIPMLPLADMAAPGIPLGHAFGRAGCYFGGCCYGVEVNADHIFAVRFPHGNPGGAPGGVPVLATQLIEAAGLVIIAIILTALYILTHKENYIKENEVLRRPVCVPEGSIICMYGMLYPVLRFTLEFYRGDLMRGIYGQFSTSQYISMFIFVFAVIVFIRQIKTAGTGKQKADLP